MIKCRDQEGICHQPGQGRGEADDDIAEDGYQQVAHHGPGNHFADTGQNGQKAVSHALNGKAPHVDDGKGNVEQGIVHQELVSLVDHHGFRGIHKEQGNHTAADRQEDAGQNRVDTADHSGGADTLPDAFRLSGTGILPGVGGHGAAQGIKGTAEEHTDLLPGGDRGHCNGAQGVNGGLDYHGADGGNGVLQPHGNAHHAKLIQVAAADAGFLPLHFQNVELFLHIDQAENAGNSLGDHGCIGSTGSSGSHLHNEEQIQHDIQ